MFTRDPSINDIIEKQCDKIKSDVKRSMNPEEQVAYKELKKQCIIAQIKDL